MWFAEPVDCAVDVLVGEQRVWSLNPARDARRSRGLWRVPWPAALAPRLLGTARMTAREHLTGRVIWEQQVAFGHTREPMRIVDADGQPLAVTKGGTLNRSFSEHDPEILETLLDATEQVLAFLDEVAGVPAFLAFGGLLGAVRDGRLIGHDVDVDVSYLSSYNSPTDAARESFVIERMFQRAGWETWRFSADDFKVRAKGVATAAKWIDIFGAFIADDVLYVMPNVAVPVGTVALLPLSTVELEGRTMAAPAEPETLLEATYGPAWRVPDPSFKFATPRRRGQLFNSWMRSGIANRHHWYQFYTSPRSRTVPSEPSAFARWFSEREPGVRVLDIGCGTGRDSLWLAGNGHEVRGYDYAPGAVALARSHAAETGNTAKFAVLNLLDIREVLSLGGAISHESEPIDVYGRFLVHALTDDGRASPWRLGSMALRRGGRMYLEFRTGSPQDLTYEFGSHYRTYKQPEEITAEIVASGGRVEYHEEGYGMAIYKDEDPYVCRLVASWHK